MTLPRYEDVHRRPEHPLLVGRTDVEVWALRCVVGTALEALKQNARMRICRVPFDVVQGEQGWEKVYPDLHAVPLLGVLLLQNPTLYVGPDPRKAVIRFIEGNGEGPNRGGAAAFVEGVFTEALYSPSSQGLELWRGLGGLAWQMVDEEQTRRARDAALLVSTP